MKQLNDLHSIRTIRTNDGIVFVDAINRTVCGSCKAKDIKNQFNTLKEEFK